MKQISKALNAYGKNKKQNDNIDKESSPQLSRIGQATVQEGSASHVSSEVPGDKPLIKTTVSKPVFPSFVSTELQKSADSKSPVNLKKVAKFLVIVGKEQASQILSHLPKDQIEEIVSEMGKVKRIYPEERDVLIKEFGALNTSSTNDTGGTAFVAEVLNKSFGKEKTKDIMNRICPEELIKPFDFLDDFSPSQIFTIIREENIGVLSFIMLQLDRKKSAQVLIKFPIETQKNLISRMKDFKSLDPEIAKHVINGIKRRADELRKGGDNVDIDGGDILGRILSHMKDGQESSILKSLDPELSSKLEEQIYTVDLVYRLSSGQLESILSDFDDQEIVYLLQGREARFMDTLLAAVSKNRRIYIEGAMTHPGRLSPIEKKAVERDFIKALRLAVDENDDIVS